MALIRLDHTPQTVGVCLPLYVIVPDPGAMKEVPVRERKLLYLLHGLSDDASAWTRYSSIETVANDYGLVVAMPSVGRSFYADQLNGQRFFTYLTEELPAYLHAVFGLAPSREDTLVAGLDGRIWRVQDGFPLSRALRGGMQSFRRASSLDILDNEDDQRVNELAYVFGDLKKLHGTEHDPIAWLDRATRSPATLPRLFMACGKQDDLFPLNQQFHAACQQRDIPIDYVEEDGKHDWYFWDRHIKRFLRLAPGEPQAG